MSLSLWVSVISDVDNFLNLCFSIALCKQTKPAEATIALISTPTANKDLAGFIKVRAWVIALQLMRTAVYADRSRMALIIWKTDLITLFAAHYRHDLLLLIVS
jgi:hypothetical protein